MSRGPCQNLGCTEEIPDWRQPNAKYCSPACTQAHGSRKAKARMEAGQLAIQELQITEEALTAAHQHIDALHALLANGEFDGAQALAIRWAQDEAPFGVDDIGSGA